MPRRSRRRFVALALALLLPLSLVTAPVATAAPPAPALVDSLAAAASPTVTVAGSLQSELGCAGDWDPTCAATDLAETSPGVFTATFTVPGGSYEFKIAHNHSWDESYGAGGGSANIPLVLGDTAAVLFSYDLASHVTTVSPVAQQTDRVTAADRDLAGSSLRAGLTRERFYFVMTDRFANADTANDKGGLTGDRLSTGYDPTDKGFYHGGDIKGITGKLDYLKKLGVTSVWMTPSFKNQPVQGTGDAASAGYHGYWITDFTQIDPHLGTNADLKTLIADAHAKGIKVFFDIITNHTADVIDNTKGTYDYITKQTAPYVDATGKTFDDRDYVNGNTFPSLDAATSFPLPPVVPADKAHVKAPDWLNDPIYYHNRGNAKFDGGESDVYGDFSGLDDLFTENPRVRDGLIDVYKYWAQFGIDGFRIDTVKHVNIEFWQKFIPSIEQAAAQVGKPKFFQFGEVYDASAAKMSRFTTEGKLPATLDFGFQAAATNFGKGGATTGLRDLYADDDYYTDTDSNAYELPTFLGNHDMGRIGNFLGSKYSGDQLLDRDLLTQSLMFLTRGQPVTYYGDEQGFTGDNGGDKNARQDMFASQVASYNDDDLIGTDKTTATDSYGTDNPLFKRIAELSKLRDKYPALADGAQIHRYASNNAGIYAFSRIDAKEQVEFVVAANNSDAPATATFAVYNKNSRYSGVWPSGTRSLRSDDEGRVTVTVPARSVAVWKADGRLARSKSTAAISFRSSVAGQTVGGRAEVGVAVPSGGFNQVSFAWRALGTTAWNALGTDDNAPYRVFQDVTSIPKGTLVEYRAVLKDNAGHLSATGTWATVGDPAPPASTSGGNDNVTQPANVSVPGDLNSEMGCLDPAMKPLDWAPDCNQAQLAKRSDDIWSGTYTLPAGEYSYKAAINKSWDENYGAKAVKNGGNIAVTVPAATPVTFYYDHRTHWATSDVQGPIVTAAGSFQSELGCTGGGDSGDWLPGCLRSWLEDPDGDGVYTYTTGLIPAGSYEVKVTHGQSWDVNYGAGGAAGGGNIAFSVGSGALTTFSYVLSTHVLTVTTKANSSADLSASKAQWLTRDVVAMDLPAAASTWHFRLYWSKDASLGIDAEALTGGDSVPLTLDPTGLSRDLKKQYPQLAAYDALRLRSSDARDKRLLTAILQGQVAIAAFDDLGRLVDATGVQLPGVLDDLYHRATKRTLGITWNGRKPLLSVWAPTAQSVSLLITPPGWSTEQSVAMRRDDDGVWSARGSSSWNGATYRYRVTVYQPTTGKVEVNDVTDPYSVALTTNSARSVIVDLDAASLTPSGWSSLRKPALAQPEDSTIYELHVRDFSIGDTTVPSAHRGGYLAFTDTNSNGMKHLKALAAAGLNTIHLLPAFDIATIPEVKADQTTPACDLPALTVANPAGEQQQACVSAQAATDGYNWGYDPFHYTVPEGSYATNPDGPSRTLEFRQMVSSLNHSGLRVVMDVVYNHTTAAGQDPKSVLDQVVPGYYQRLSATGTVENSTCCANTATEHAMMGKLLIDSVLTWAADYKVDGFRFDLMGHQPKAVMVQLRSALDKLSVHRNGVDGKQIYLYGEGWNFGEVADNARFVQASQLNMAGTGIGTFNDRIRDSVRGGGPFDADPRLQGFGTGLFTDPNANTSNAGEAAKATLLLDEDRIKIGLVGNLKDYTFVDRTGATVTGAQVDYNGAPTGYTADPSEVINYVDAHDNETLFDALTYKLPLATSMADRVRMNTLSLATVTLGQGPSFWHAGADLLRSKSLDRDSYDSGDWFNRIDFSGRQSTFGSGLPVESKNSDKWPYMRDLLANPALKPGAADMAAATAGAQSLLKVRSSSPLFRLGSASLIQQKVSFPSSGPSAIPGVIVMQIDDRPGRNIDPRLKRIVVVFNATPNAQTIPLSDAAGLALNPVQANGSDPVVKQTSVTASSVTVPPRTVAVLQQ